jgi:hypothetical protein
MRIVALLLAAVGVAAAAPSAEADHFIGMQFGRHRYAGSFQQSVLGLTYDYQFADSSLSLGGGADYLSNDFGGDAGARGFRVAPAANLHVPFNCLPLDVVGGVGLEYTHVTGTHFARQDAVGPYGRVRFLLRVTEEFYAGLAFRKSYSVFDTLGEEAAVVLQFNISSAKKKPKRPEPVRVSI